MKNSTDLKDVALRLMLSCVAAQAAQDAINGTNKEGKSEDVLEMIGCLVDTVSTIRKAEAPDFDNLADAVSGLVFLNTVVFLKKAGGIDPKTMGDPAGEFRQAAKNGVADILKLAFSA